LEVRVMRWRTKVSAVLGSLAAVVLLSGCPYRSDVPLDSPAPADPRLVGQWREETSPTTAIYTVEADGATGYRITVKSEENTVYKAFLTPLGDKTYVNLQEGSDTGSYSLFRLEIADDGASFTLYPVTENITEQFTDSAALREFVTKYQDLSFFFEKPTQYVHADHP
jgi:hypothetical protein